VARRPRTPYVAGLVGLVLLRGVARGPVVDVDGGGVLPTGGAGEGPVLVAVAPEAVRLSVAPEPGSWPAVVRAVEQQGTAVRVVLDGPPTLTALVPARRLAELDLRAGTRLQVRVPPEDVAVYR
jgi:molybdate transport system ATP-binding protein